MVGVLLGLNDYNLAFIICTMLSATCTALGLLLVKSVDNNPKLM